VHTCIDYLFVYNDPARQKLSVYSQVALLGLTNYGSLPRS